jgi:hypothetical protein
MAGYCARQFKSSALTTTEHYQFCECALRWRVISNHAALKK